MALYYDKKYKCFTKFISFVKDKEIWESWIFIGQICKEDKKPRRIGVHTGFSGKI